MKLPKKKQYVYNRYMDSLSLKASEAFSLQTEAEFKVKELRNVEFAKTGIAEGLLKDLISKLTSLSIEKIQNLDSNTLLKQQLLEKSS
jgi:hypothetical protein